MKITTLGAVVLVLATGVRGQADDECSGATPISGLPMQFSNGGYTTSAEPWACGSFINDRWFHFVPIATRPYSIRACNTGQAVDTAIEIYRGSCSQLTFVACGDDECGHLGVGAVASAILTAGVPYLVRVGLAGSSALQYTLEVQTGPGWMASAAPSGCGGTWLSFQGLPVIGGSVTTTVENATGAAYIGVGLTSNIQSLCICTIGHDWTYWTTGATYSLSIPPSVNFINTWVFFQGADIGGANGCPGAGLDLTDTVLISIGV